MPMPIKSVPRKFCCHCGRRLRRKRFMGGALECVRDYLRRRYCNQACMGQGKRTLLPRLCDFCKRSYRPANSVRYKHRYCSRACHAAHKTKNPAETVAKDRARYEARKITTRKLCSTCGVGKALVVHHKDDNPLNNARSNHQVLCRKCHGQHHNPERRSKQACSVCGRTPAKSFKKYGVLCDKHYRRCKTHGNAFTVLVPGPNGRRAQKRLLT